MWVSTRTCESLAVAQSSAGHGININTLPGGWWIPANGSVKRRWCTQTHIHMHHNMWRERAEPWLRENMAFLSCNVNFIIFNLVIFWPTFSVFVHTMVQNVTTGSDHNHEISSTITNHIPCKLQWHSEECIPPPRPRRLLYPQLYSLRSRSPNPI